MIELVITGGQTGADLAGWAAARRYGIPTDGWMPAGYLTEDGPRPEYRELYDAREMPTASYPARTEANGRLARGLAGGCLWFGDPETPGGKLTLGWCRKLSLGVVKVADGVRPSRVVGWIEEQRIKALWVAGNRASKAPEGFGERVEAFLGVVFGRLGGSAG